MKYLKYLIAIALLIPSISYGAVAVGWNATSTTQGWIQPNLVNGVLQTIIGNNFTATSTTATSTFAGPVGVNPYFYVGPYLYSGLYPNFDGNYSGDNFIADFTKDIDDYASVSLNNPNASINSSIDLTFNNNLTSDTNGDGEYDYYADIGFNSSTYNVPYYGLQNVPNMFYMYNKDGPVNFTSATSSTSGYIQFVTGGFNSEAMRITSTGAVGIGSTSPTARFVVTNPLSTATAVFEDEANDASPFFIDASGNVNIGTTTIGSHKLFVENSLNGDVVSRVENSNSGVSARAILQVANTISSSDSLSFIAGGTGYTVVPSWVDSGVLLAGSGMSGGFKIVSQAGGMRFSASAIASSDILIAQSGNVGIGQATPVYKLHVATTTTLAVTAARIISGGVDGIRLQNLDNTNDSGTVLSFILRSSGTSHAAIAARTPSSNNSNFGFFTESSDSFTEKMTLSPEGNLGIGTTSPYGKLSVTQTGTGGNPSFLVEDIASPDTTPFIITERGDVGIGTTTPGSKLTIVSGGSINCPQVILATSTSMTVDFNAGCNQLVRMGTSATSIAFSNGQPGQKIELEVCNPGSTAGALTFTGAISYRGGIAPSNTTTANQCDVYSWTATYATSTIKYRLTGMASGFQ